MNPVAATGWLGQPLMALVVVAVAMIGEAVVSARHDRALRTRGAVEPPDDVHRWMQVIYPLGFLACGAEQWWAPRAWSIVGVIGVAVFLAGQKIKYVAMATLGESWSYRVLPVPGVPPIRRGIYRWLRPPNYVGVAGEVVGFGLWMRAPIAGVEGAEKDQVEAAGKHRGLVVAPAGARVTRG